MSSHPWNAGISSIHLPRRMLLSLMLLFGVGLASVVGAQETDSRFKVSYKSEVEPLPLNRIHSWVLHVETADARPVENAVIKVDGGMPAHNHGLPTQPVVTEIGNGDYLVQGLKFSMTGHWEMWFQIQADGIVEKKKFDVDF